MGNCSLCVSNSAVHTFVTNSVSNTANSLDENGSLHRDPWIGSSILTATSSGGDRQHVKAHDGTFHAFSFADLKAATRNFRLSFLLGEGGFGCVYKGYVDEQTLVPTRTGQGMVVAVKMLNLRGRQGHKEWLAEIRYLGALHHLNLVKLIGFCAEDDHKLLVYEFMPRGSLENHLFRKGNNIPTLSWALRMKIIVGAARGLAYLHDAKVIFRDFKPSNILLDSQYNVKLSDFGLAKDGPAGDNTHVSTQVMGTQGYAAPEYLSTGHLSVKSDIYSFGVVLLEILSGRRVLDRNRPSEEENLVDWAKPYLTDNRRMQRVLDPRLEGQYSVKGAQKIASVAHMCLLHDPKSRPTMALILEVLEPFLNTMELLKHAISSGAHDTENKVLRSGSVAFE